MGGNQQLSSIYDFEERALGFTIVLFVKGGHRAARWRRAVANPTTPFVQHEFGVPVCTPLALAAATTTP